MLISQLEAGLIDYEQVRQTCYMNMSNSEIVDVSVIVPVHFRQEFNHVLSDHWERAIENTSLSVSLTFVEHSEYYVHKDLCYPWVNYIHIPIGKSRFNKCLCHNIGALYANKASWFLFHDVDTMPPKDFFEKLAKNIYELDAVQNFTKRRLIHCNEHLTEQIKRRDCYIDDLRDGSMNTITAKSGAAGGSITCSRELFLKIGGYHETFSEYSIEDQFFLDCLMLAGEVGFCDNPPIEMFHLHHQPSFDRITKDEDFHFFNAFHAMPIQDKKHFLKIKSDHLKKYYQ
jgi:predicted glycosyltransferase involved in capsule biosynthesis